MQRRAAIHGIPEGGKRPRPALSIPARDVHAEGVLGALMHSSKAKPRRRRASPAARHGGHAAGTVGGVTLTHPERVLFGDRELTKLDLAHYFESMAEWILPHVLGRPLMILRCPQGGDGHCFVQKHFAGEMPAGLDAVEIVEEGGAVGVYGSVRSVEGLISLVQIGAIELHVWGSRLPDLERPDRLVFDLDPGPDLAWRATAAAARAVRDRLAELGLESWPKASGGKGLHVVVPLVPELDWAEVKLFARAIADSLVEEHPELYVGKSSKLARTGRVFIDYLRNARGATSIAAYSPRARAGAPVAVPLRWSDVSRALPPRYAVEGLPVRMARLRRDPWETFWKRPQSLRRALASSLPAELRPIASLRP